MQRRRRSGFCDGLSFAIQASCLLAGAALPSTRAFLRALRSAGTAGEISRLLVAQFRI